jgi:hypothetical protein
MKAGKKARVVISARELDGEDERTPMPPSLKLAIESVLKQLRAKQRELSARLRNPKAGHEQETAKAELKSQQLAQVIAYLEDCIKVGFGIKSFKDPDELKWMSSGAALRAIKAVKKVKSAFLAPLKAMPTAPKNSVRAGDGHFDKSAVTASRKGAASTLSDPELEATVYLQTLVQHRITHLKAVTKQTSVAEKADGSGSRPAQKRRK